MPEYALGRRPLFDEKSRAFRALTAPTLKTVLHSPPPLGRRLDQGSLGACTGFAVSQALNTDRHHHEHPWLTAAEARTIYANATRIDPWPGSWPPDDTGSSVLAATKAIQTRGFITSYRWAFGLDQALAALVLNPIVVGTNWHQGMYQPDSKGFIHPRGSVVGGHAYCLHGINVRDRYVWILNSWSISWGIKGRAKMSFADLGQLLADDGEAVALIR